MSTRSLTGPGRRNQRVVVALQDISERTLVGLGPWGRRGTRRRRPDRSAAGRWKNAARRA
ncbi:hypothetical protein AvCA_37940 [Azotobacter vinelandii CA]|uniref:Uncharacterized protein n=2 Tax=Azotobacter vinelandii TaxID=354 RepID=C1DS63_AZOVD|nr:hypothetical protein Avin_37940 [Azotobacter vinelandii DJ]AGK16155.1 hypothetical protein AvCA_37940 [Azotobacter vinelandii CA]AGK21611.1 hypothetical protein AvCA6_37940 [Azotobacter vinelandii CA6]